MSPVPASDLTTVDPKVFFANERTFLKWLHTAVTLGSIATGLLGLSSSNAMLSPSAAVGLRYVGLLLLFLAIFFTLHALKTFRERANKLNTRSSEGFDDNRGPLALAGVLVVAIAGMYFAALLKVRGATAPHSGST